MADVGNIAEHNKGVKVLQVIIDVPSKYLRVVPLKSEHSKSVHNAMKQQFFEGTAPKHIFSDRGPEFTNAKFKELCNEYNIIQYTTLNVETKAAVAESSIRTLKSKLNKYITKHNTKTYLPVVQDIVDTYNKTKNRYGFRPIDVTKQNEKQILRICPPTEGVVKIPLKFHLGDNVRV